MTREERGLYIILLCMQWNVGFVTADDFDRLGSGMAEPSLKHVIRKFEADAEGLYRNKRLEQVRQEQQLYKETRQKAGKAGAEARWHPHGSANANAMANDGSPSPTPTPLKPRERERHFPEAVVPKWEEVKTMADLAAIPETVAREFFDHYDSKNLWANKHGTPVNVRGCLIVWNNNQKKINANPNRNQTRGPVNPRLAGQADDPNSKRARLAAARTAQSP